MIQTLPCLGTQLVVVRHDNAARNSSLNFTLPRGVKSGRYSIDSLHFGWREKIIGISSSQRLAGLVEGLVIVCDDRAYLPHISGPYKFINA